MHSKQLNTYVKNILLIRYPLQTTYISHRCDYILAKLFIDSRLFVIASIHLVYVNFISLAGVERCVYTQDIYL